MYIEPPYNPSLIKSFGNENPCRWCEVWQHFFLPQMETDAKNAHVSDLRLKGEFQAIEGMGDLITGAYTAPSRLVETWSAMKDGFGNLEGQREAISSQTGALFMSIEMAKKGYVPFYPQDYFARSAETPSSLFDDVLGKIDVQGQPDFSGGVLQMMTWFSQFLPKNEMAQYDVHLRLLKSAHEDSQRNPSRFEAELFHFREHVGQIVW